MIKDEELKYNGADRLNFLFAVVLFVYRDKSNWNSCQITVKSINIHNLLREKKKAVTSMNIN